MVTKGMQKQINAMVSEYKANRIDRMLQAITKVIDEVNELIRYANQYSVSPFQLQRYLSDIVYYNYINRQLSISDITYIERLVYTRIAYINTLDMIISNCD
jgi:hypothetical protein